MECLRVNAESCKFAVTTSLCERKTLKAYKPMKIVQTFWSGGRSPLEHSYGWPHAEYNLMSWTLSCLSLRRHYDRVELYTDRRGYEVLIGKLHLPYTAVHVVYDDDLCLPQHWAYAKVKTYSMQAEPFLHIDGDVYFPKPLPRELLDAPLVAQNREIGTAYYQGMMDRVLSHPEFKLPPFIRETLDNGTMASYNMGIFGGCDLDFIHRYCQEVFSFFETNRMNDPSVEYSNEECNVFFEQIFLAALADREKREVKTLISSSIIDNGYQNKDFANLRQYEERTFFHVLGGMKSRSNNCRQLARVLLRTSKESYLAICHGPRQRRQPVVIADNENSGIFNYKLHIWNCLVEWDRQDREEVERQALCTAHYRDFILSDSREGFQIEKAKFFSLYEIPDTWGEADRKLLYARLDCPETYSLKHVGIVPVSHKIGYEEFYLTEDEVDILSLIGDCKMTQDEITNAMMKKYWMGRTGDSILGRLEHFYRREVSRMIELGVLIASK